MNTKMQDQDFILSVKNLQTDFHGPEKTVHAVSDVNFDLQRGSTLAIVGESGSGKSITARSILHILDPGGVVEKGQALFSPEPDGRIVDLLALDPRGDAIRSIRGKEISMIFQEPMASLSPMHTIGSHLVEVLRIHLGLSKSDAWDHGIELLRRVGITEPESRMKSYSFQLSGGMCQRAMTAIALACEPKLLIADEPTTALDVTTQARVLDLLEELKSTADLSMLFITHDLGVVARVADSVAVMHNGMIVEQGAVEQIFHDPQHDYTKRLLLASTPKRAMTSYPEDALILPDAYDQAPIAKIHDLHVTFTEPTKLFSAPKVPVQAVRGVTFDIFPGETLGLVGESGSGKTTTGRCLVTAENPTSGSITYLDGQGRENDVLNLTSQQKRNFRTEVRMIFQDPYTSLNPRMTLLDIIAEPLRINRLANGSEIKEKVALALRRVGMLPDHMNRYPHAFSGGQRQRINIARALITDPRLVVADEAVSALDVSVRAQILELLKELQSDLGLTYLFISHDLSVVEAICDRVAVMQRGRIVELEPTSSLFASPQHTYTQTLLEAVPVADPRVYA